MTRRTRTARITRRQRVGGLPHIGAAEQAKVRRRATTIVSAFFLYDLLWTGFAAVNHFLPLSATRVADLNFQAHLSIDR